MSNLTRPIYVEAMVKMILGDRWTLLADWNGWDLERDDKKRLEVKQSAARQPWSAALGSKPSPARFDIAPRKGYWTDDGSRWVDQVGRFADVYVFAHHPVFDEDLCDQRDSAQWQFWILPTPKLPESQKSIGIDRLTKLGAIEASHQTLGSAVQRALDSNPTP
jgi:hypothetical protein